MATIQLQYDEIMAISREMRQRADNFGGNHTKLKAAVRGLGDSFSGRVPDAMLQELDEMNKGVAQIQQALAGLANLTADAANILKTTDEANRDNIRQ